MVILVISSVVKHPKRRGPPACPMMNAYPMRVSYVPKEREKREKMRQQHRKTQNRSITAAHPRKLPETDASD
jgi:hypothetical protein